MSTTPRIAQAISTAIQQQALAGSIFDGTEPVGDAPLDAGNSIYKYATSAVGGGLFFWNNREPLVCSQIHVDLGAPGDITVSLVNLDPVTWPTNPTPLPDERRRGGGYARSPTSEGCYGSRKSSSSQ